MGSRVRTVCPYCGVGCTFDIVLEDGRAAGLEYATDHPVSEGSLCPKGNAALEVLDHSERLTVPLIKEGGRFREVTWDEALDLIGRRLSAVRESFGAAALGFLASAKCTNEENYLFQKLARMLGTNNVDHCARLCHAPTVVGLGESLGSAAMTNPISDLENAGCILVIGSNFAENHAPVSRWVWRAKDRGAQVIVADPRLTPTAWMADLYLQLRPGTDVALLNGLMHVILSEGLADRGFIAQRTSGVQALVKHLEAYTPVRVAEITGVDAAQIVAAARTYATAPAATLVYCMGITQHTTGTDNVLACADLALICGQVGRPGAGIMPLRGQNNVQGACDMGALAGFYPGYRRVDDPQARDDFARVWDLAIGETGGQSLPLSLQPGLTVVEMMQAAAERQLRSLYIMGENPVVSDPNAGLVEEALAKLDLLVVQDVFPTETALLADVILPAAAWAEKSGSYTSTERRVQWSHRAVLPPGEARDDAWILSRVAQRLNLRWSCSGPENVLAEINQAVPSYAGLTADRLARSACGLFWPCPAPDHAGITILHTDGFPTANGRARLTPVEYRAPVEEPVASFPVKLTTGREVVHYNAGSMTRRSPSLLAYSPGLLVKIHPEDAEKLSLSDGDRVTVRTTRGQTLAEVRITDTVGNGQAFLPFHFAGTNRLTIDALDPQSKIPEYKVSACNITAANAAGNEAGGER